MGKKTEVVNAARRERIQKYTLWLVEQQPAVQALAGYVEDGFLFGQPPPPQGDDGDDLSRYPITGKLVLLPPAPDVDVVIPAGSRQILIVPETRAAVRGSRYIPFTLAMPMNRQVSGRRTAWRLELSVGQEIALPGGSVAKLVLRDGKVAIDDGTPDVPSDLSAGTGEVVADEREKRDAE